MKPNVREKLALQFLRKKCFQKLSFKMIPVSFDAGTNAYILIDREKLLV